MVRKKRWWRSSDGSGWLINHSCPSKSRPNTRKDLLVSPGLSWRFCHPAPPRLTTTEKTSIRGTARCQSFYAAGLFHRKQEVSCCAVLRGAACRYVIAGYHAAFRQLNKHYVSKPDSHPRLQRPSHETFVCGDIIYLHARRYHRPPGESLESVYLITASEAESASSGPMRGY